MPKRNKSSSSNGKQEKKVKVSEVVEEEEEVKEETREEEEEVGVDEEEEDDDNSPPPSFDGQYVNKQRCLVFSSRGVTARARHVLEDIRQLIPHHQKEVKLDTKDDPRVVNEIAEIKSCNSALYFESRKRSDLYLWASKTPHGPSAKFLVSNIHTMDELRLTGNTMLGSRPILSFDSVFDTQPHFMLLKPMFIDIFGTPRGHPKSKPFIDRVMSFYVADGKIWVRNYQILDAANGDKKAQAAAELTGAEATQLIEVGPRFVLNPIRIFAGSFGGPTLYLNPKYISPNTIRQANKANKGNKYQARKDAVSFRKEKEEVFKPQLDELADTFN
jgi:ribosome biogenesis protein BRX1